MGLGIVFLAGFFFGGWLAIFSLKKVIRFFWGWSTHDHLPWSSKDDQTCANFMWSATTPKGAVVWCPILEPFNHSISWPTSDEVYFPSIRGTKVVKKTLPSKPKNNILWLWVFFPQKNNNMDPQNWWISRCMYVLIFFGDIFRFHMLGPFRSVNKNESNMSPPFIQPMPQAETKGTDINVEQLGGRVSNVTEKLNRFQFGCVCWLCFCLPSKIA